MRAMASVFLRSSGLMGLFLLGSTLTQTVNATDACRTFQCPAGNVCGCIDCSVCNSGSFALACMCHPVQGQVTCTVISGDCPSQCASCKSVSTSQTCTSYSGCPGMTCGIGGCTGPAGAPVAASPLVQVTSCVNCFTTAIPDSTSTTIVHFQIPADMPIAVSEVAAGWENGVFSFHSYHITNTARAGLITLVVVWNFENLKGQHVVATTVTDSWDLDAAFVSSRTDADVLAALAIRGGSVSQAVATVVYAEFDDGSRIGPLKDHFHGLLECQRKDLLAKHQSLLAYFASGASISDVKKRLVTTPGLDRLRMVHATSGMDAVLLELQKTRKLNP